jgi:hypothetical protein
VAAWQADTLREARDRVGTLVSAAAVIAGLGAGVAFNDPKRVSNLEVWGAASTGVAAVALGASVLAAAMIWRPLKGVFVLDSELLVGGYVEGEPPASLTEMHRALAIHLGRHARRNADEIQARLWWFTVALVAFVVEVAALLVVLLDVA